MKQVLLFISLAVLVPACTNDGSLAVSPEPGLIRSFEAPPPGSDPNSCWGKDVSPAVIETVTERVLVQPAEIRDDGTVVADPVYREETKRSIVKERRELWFETPCQEQLTPDIIATLQRALKARGLYAGPLSGNMDGRTRHAIRRFQAPEGLDSSILSLWAARKLGLVAIARDKS